jgi:hypothetical protein
VGSKRDYLSAFNSVQFTMYYIRWCCRLSKQCQFQVWELNIWQFIVIVELKYFLNLNKYHLPIFILSIHNFRQIPFFKITKDIQSNNNNTILLFMLYAEICPKVGRHNALLRVVHYAFYPWDIFRHIKWTTQYHCINSKFII